MNVKVRRLSADAVIPVYATDGAAGFDLVAIEDVIIAPGETVKVPLGLAFEIPADYEMQIRPRSGATLKTKLRVQFGTVDADYRGEVSVVVDNIRHTREGVGGRVETLTGDWLSLHGEISNSYIIRKGERIAQGVIAPVLHAEFKAVDDLSQTVRGNGGFGHTGTTYLH